MRAKIKASPQKSVIPEKIKPPPKNTVQERGPRDKKGRSLRDLDLAQRMFTYPCSYLVYSPSISALPKEEKNYVFRRLREVLTSQDPGDKFKHLSEGDRKAIREILAETLPEFRS